MRQSTISGLVEIITTGKVGAQVGTIVTDRVGRSNRYGQSRCVGRKNSYKSRQEQYPATQL